MMAWGVPPPPPPRPANLANLTMDELRRMEGTERRNIEARLQLLREIQTMLDASVLLMQQYSTVVATLPLNIANVATQTEMSRTEPSPEPSPVKVKTEPDVVPTTSSYKPAAGPSTSNATMDATNLTDDSPADSPTPDSLNANRDKTDADAEELRRRRLQKFAMEQ